MAASFFSIFGVRSKWSFIFLGTLNPNYRKILQEGDILPCILQRFIKIFNFVFFQSLYWYCLVIGYFCSFLFWKFWIRFWRCQFFVLLQSILQKPFYFIKIETKLNWDFHRMILIPLEHEMNLILELAKKISATNQWTCSIVV